MISSTRKESFREEDSASIGTDIGICAGGIMRIREAGADFAAFVSAGADRFPCESLSLTDPAFDWSRRSPFEKIGYSWRGHVNSIETQLS